MIAVSSMERKTTKEQAPLIDLNTQNTKLGKKSTISGNKIITIISVITAAKNGKASRVYSSSSHFKIPHTVNVATPAKKLAAA
ncbi:hypothetical protein AwWohl_01990 [Gammaproteobacteria bacterium]|nr:hypothetical protein AwWohl_01990 [Gammaproteobacteria bacterium]